MEHTILQWLTADQFKILKQIIIISDRNNQETELGSIFYTRPFSDHYNLIKQQEEDKLETDLFAKFFQEYPKQQNYPYDQADIILLDAIKNRYPKSIVRNDTLLFNTDLEKLVVMKNRNIVPATMYFSPEFSNTDIFLHAGKQFPAPRIGFNIYTYHNIDELQSPIFYAKYPAEDQKVLNLFSTIHFE